MKIDLQANISSRQDLKAAILEIRRYSSWYGQTAVKMRASKNDSYEQPTFSQAATNIINEWNKVDPVSQQSLEELIRELEDYDRNAPVATITLAAPAPNSLKKSIIAWFRQNVDPNILVDFRFNSTMLGGMVVQYGSHIYDWSFRRQVLAARDKFPEVLKRV